MAGILISVVGVITLVGGVGIFAALIAMGRGTKGTQ
jgi:hypothetical protein